MLSDELMNRLLGLTPRAHSERTTVTCPVCNLWPMYASPDPNAGGLWWACSRGCFSGTSLQLYQQVRGFPSTRIAWISLVGEARLTLPAALENVGAVASFDRLLLHRKTLQDFRDSSQRNLVGLPPRSVTRLIQENLWRGDTGETILNGIGRFLGVARTGRILEAALALEVSGIRKGFHQTLVLPFESSPGLPCAFLFWGDQSVVRSALDEQRDGGLMGLSHLITNLNDKDEEGDAYAVGEPRMFLRLQQQWIHDNMRTMPLVCYAGPEVTALGGRPTCTSWAALPHRRVILWAPYRSVSLLNDARRVGPRGHIALEPELPEALGLDPLLKFHAGYLARRWSKTAVPWLEALRQWLLDSSPADAQILVDGLEAPLGAQELKDLEAACTAKEWAKLGLLLKRDGRATLFSLDGRQFVERPGLGVYWINPAPRRGEPLEMLITEALPVFSEIAVVDGETWVKGEVRHEGHTVPFSLRMEEAHENLDKILLKLCVDAGLGAPHIHTQWRKKLTDLAMAYQKPRTVKGISRVGWDEAEGGWVLPNCIVKPGEVLPRESTLSVPTLPCCRVGNTVVKPQRDFGNATESSANATALIAALVWNMWRDRQGLPKVGIALLGERGAEAAFYGLGTYLGLQAVLAGMKGEKLPAVIEVQKKHGVPVMLQHAGISGPNWEEYLRFGGPHNVVLRCRESELVRLVTTGTWIAIRCGVTGDWPENADAYLLSRLAHTLKKPNVPTPYDTLENDRNISELMDRDSAYTADLVHAMAWDRMVVTPEEEWKRLLWSAFNLVTQGAAGMGPQSKALRLDKNNDLEIAWDKLVKSYRKSKLTPPDPDLIDIAAHSGGDALCTTDSGWRVPSGVWQAEFRKWNTLVEYRL